MNGAVNLTGYKLTFDAEMTSSADMSQFNTTFENGDRTIAGNNEQEYYADNNPNSPSDPFSFANGALNITARPVPAAGLPYTSGLLTTAGIFSQNTGYFEIRAETPTGSGFWPTFWLLAPDYSSEVDIMEDPNLFGPDTYYDSVKSSSDTSYYVNTGADVSSSYHTYGFMWTPTTIQFTLDGQYVGSANATPAALANAKLYLLINLAVGGWAATPPAGAQAQYSIDYVRAYSNSPTAVAIAPETVSKPDTANLPVLPSVGSTGKNNLVLQLSEDAYQGDAQFTVTVDGVQQGGTYTVSALKSLQQTQSLTIYADLHDGNHTVSVDFLNDAWGGSGALDRNLYLNQATLNGNVLSGSTLNLFNTGVQSFGFAIPYTFSPTVVVGSGPDVLALQVSEDAYKGTDAQFKIVVDGTQVGGVQTATALKGIGSTQAFDVLGNFGTGQHYATVNFINGASGTSASAPNLYVTQASINNASVPGASVTETTAGYQSFSFQASSPVNGTTTGTASAAPTLLTLHLNEDAYQGDAQFLVSIDGTQIGGAQSVTALANQGATQAFTFADVLSAGTHDVAVSFTNDLYGGPGLDRNLYVLGADLNATALNKTAWTASLFSNGTSHFSLVVPS